MKIFNKIRSRRLLPNILIGISCFAYFIALFPSRNHWDTVEILRLSRFGKTSDQWTALYFRFIELLSIGGRFAFVPAAFGLISLTLSVIFFVNSLPLSSRTRNSTIILACLSPFVGFFGMTLTHEVQTTSGVLLLSGILIRESFNTKISNKGIVTCVGVVFSVMTFVGILIAVSFFLANFNRKNPLLPILASLCVAVLSIFSGQLLHVETVSSSTKMQAFLGDVKCIVQHPNSKISEDEWKLLDSFGDLNLWKLTSSCSATSSNVMFTTERLQGRELVFLKLWYKLITQNPQIALQARIQRAANALPPPFFQSQPNFSSRNFLEPVGVGTSDDLQQWSPVFKTSNDDPYQESRFRLPSAIRLFEYVAVVPAFVINSQSWFWGWGGLWFVVFLVILVVGTPLRYSQIFRILIPQIVTILGLFLFSPVSDPRYSYWMSLIGILTSLAYGINYLQMRSQNEQIRQSFSPS